VGRENPLEVMVILENYRLSCHSLRFWEQERQKWKTLQLKGLTIIIVDSGDTPCCSRHSPEN
jgi:hypothetical protein